MTSIQPAKIRPDFLQELLGRRSGKAKCPSHGSYLIGACVPCAEHAREESREFASKSSDWTENARQECDKLFPLNFKSATVTDLAIAAWVRGFIAGSRRSLFINGLVGRGKSWQAFGALRESVTQKNRITWIAQGEPEILQSMRPHPDVDSEAVLTQYRKVGVLLIDDLGTSKGSEWVEQALYRLVNYRYENALPTIFTSNVEPEEMVAKIGDRLTSRIAGMCDRVSIKGADRRRVSA